MYNFFPYVICKFFRNYIKKKKKHYYVYVLSEVNYNLFLIYNLQESTVKQFCV